jgi:hypothetical protein
MDLLGALAPAEDFVVSGNNTDALLGVCELSLAAHTRSFEDRTLLPPPRAGERRRVLCGPQRDRRDVR